MGLAMKPRTLRIFHCATVLLALACAFRTLDAQVLYGSLTGNVTDPSSAAVPGAKVTALNIDTGLSREATTDDRGAYIGTCVPVRRTTSTCLTQSVPLILSAPSTYCFSGTRLPPRSPSSAVMTTVEVQSAIRPPNASDEKPANTTE